MIAFRCKGLVLAGGLGTRLRPLTNDTPKCLIPVHGKPLLDYWLARFATAGIHDVLINTHHLREKVRDYIERVNSCGQIQLFETYEPVLLGSAGTIHANREWLDDADTCLIVYADNLSDIDLLRFLDYHHSHAQPFTMMLFHTAFPEKCGIASMDASGHIVEFVEKPRAPTSNLANGGVYAVTAEAYREIADMAAFDLGFDVLPSFVGRMMGWVWDGYHRDLGTPEALQQAEQDLASDTSNFAGVVG